MYASKNFLVSIPSIKSCIGRLCSSLLGISVTAALLNFFRPIFAKAVSVASKYAAFESTIVPSKSRIIPLTFIPYHYYCLSV